MPLICGMRSATPFDMERTSTIPKDKTDALLELKIAVPRNEDITNWACTAEQTAVFNTGPAKATHDVNSCPTSRAEDLRGPVRDPCKHRHVVSTDHVRSIGGSAMRV